jgi:hypothetical protein
MLYGKLSKNISSLYFNLCALGISREDICNVQFQTDLTTEDIVYIANLS